MYWKQIVKNTVVTLAVVLNKVGLDIPSIPSAAAIIVKGSKILVVKLSYKNGYALPGGAVMRGESLEQAVSREVKEETGLTAYGITYFGSYSEEDDGRYSFNVTFLAKVKGKLKSSREGEAKWLPLKKIQKKIVYEDNKKAVGEYVEKYLK